MKNFFLLLTLFISGFCFAQTKSITKKMPIYFGCEENTENRSLVACMNANLSHDIQNQVTYFSNIADYLQVQSAKSKLKFTINKEGKFSDLYAEGDNPIFNSVAMSSLILLQSKMDKAKLTIRPGKDENNNPVDVVMSLPLRYESDNKDNDFEKFPVFERVLFTIKTNEENIEVRIDKDFNLKTYGNNGDREYYLGKFSNLFEIASVDPYTEAFENGFKTGLIDVTKGLIDGKEYKIQIKNFFENDPNVEVLIIVFREENGSWAEYYEYKTKKEFNQSKFAKLTYR